MLVYRLLPLFLLLMSALPVQAADLGITVDGLRSSTGTVLVGLYDTPAGFENAIKQAAKDGFLNDPDRVAGVALRATAAMTSGIVFRNIEPGRYAIILFHDANGNGRLDVNFWGVPTEPYGFSNDAEGAFEAPSFAAASMLLDGVDHFVTIHLVFHQGGLVEDMAK